MKALGAVGLHRPVGARGALHLDRPEGGGAKDGDDKTDPAILKMFYVDGKKQKIEFVDYIRAALNIVPVSISCELDPTDKAKARGSTRSRSTAAMRRASSRTSRVSSRASSARRAGTCLLRRPHHRGLQQIGRLAALIDKGDLEQLSPLPGQLPGGGWPGRASTIEQSAFLTASRGATRAQRPSGAPCTPSRWKTPGKGFEWHRFEWVMEKKREQMLLFFASGQSRGDWVVNNCFSWYDHPG